MDAPFLPPLIGITGRRPAAGAVRSYHPRFTDLHIDVFWSDNGRRVLEAGGIPVLLPFESSHSGVIDRCAPRALGWRRRCRQS